MRGLLIGVLALVVVAASGCGDNKITGPTGVGPVITQFAVSPTTAKAPAAVDFTVKTDRATACEILTIGDVSCNAVKSWSIATAGTHTFTLLAFGANGVVVRQSVVVVVTP